jgi:hypothetical protein
MIRYEYLVIPINRRWHLLELKCQGRSVLPISHAAYDNRDAALQKALDMGVERIHFCRENITEPLLLVAKCDADYWQRYLDKATVLNRNQVAHWIEDPFS